MYYCVTVAVTKNWWSTYSHHSPTVEKQSSWISIHDNKNILMLSGQRCHRSIILKQIYTLFIYASKYSSHRPTIKTRIPTTDNRTLQARLHIPSVTVFVIGTFDHFNLTCKQHHRIALKSFLNSAKKLDIDGKCKRNSNYKTLKSPWTCVQQNKFGKHFPNN